MSHTRSQRLAWDLDHGFVAANIVLREEPEDDEDEEDEDGDKDEDEDDDYESDDGYSE